MTLRRPARIVLITLAAAGLVGGGVAGGIAVADHETGHNNFSGGSIVAHRVATSTNLWQTPSAGVWHTVPGSTLTYGVSSGTIRLITAQFTSESGASGNPVQWCSVRIVARKLGSNTLFELYPRAGTDQRFDTVSEPQDYVESHSIRRSMRLGSGTWYFYAQARGSADVVCTFDDWHFQIDAHTTS